MIHGLENTRYDELISGFHKYKMSLWQKWEKLIGKFVMDGDA